MRRIALLRAVNVGGASLPMADLRAVAASLGWAEPATILQSGNLVMAGPEGPSADLEQALEAALATRRGLATDVMIRTSEQWRAIVGGNPFGAMADADPSHLVAFVLKSAVRPFAADAGTPGEERIAVADGVAYVTYPHGIGRSKLTPALLERRLGARGTGRNWNTVCRIAAALGT